VREKHEEHSSITSEACIHSVGT